MTTPTGRPNRQVGGPGYQQTNVPGPGGVVNANQGTQINNIYHPQTPGSQAKWMRRDTKVLLVLLVVNISWFFWGMLAYTGIAGNTGDMIRSIGFFLLFGMLIRLFVGWVRRRLH